MTDEQPYHPAYFDVNVQDDVTITKFHNEQLTEEDNLEQLGQELFTLVEQFQHRKIIADLTPVRHVTSAVLGKFITLHRKLVRNDGTLILCNIHPDLESVLSTSRLLTYFQTAADVDEAQSALTE